MSALFLIQQTVHTGRCKVFLVPYVNNQCKWIRIHLLNGLLESVPLGRVTVASFACTLQAFGPSTHWALHSRTEHYLAGDTVIRPDRREWHLSAPVSTSVQPTAQGTASQHCVRRRSEPTIKKTGCTSGIPGVHNKPQLKTCPQPDESIPNPRTRYLYDPFSYIPGN